MVNSVDLAINMANMYTNTRDNKDVKINYALVIKPIK